MCCGSAVQYSAAQKHLLKKAATPDLPPLARLPETPLELFRSIAVTISAKFQQPHPDGKQPPLKQDYSLPWPGFSTWRDARARLAHFETNFKGEITWASFNDATSNDGPMRLNAYPGRAFIERVTNEG